jgi:hypothetical protein
MGNFASSFLSEIFQKFSFRNFASNFGFNMAYHDTREVKKHDIDFDLALKLQFDDYQSPFENGSDFESPFSSPPRFGKIFGFFTLMTILE